VVSVEYKVNLLAPSVGERMIARGRVLRPGRTLTVCSGEVVAITGKNGGEEKPVVAMLATMMRLDRV
jgi:acyl-coenzyme A thioesterase PaaI-like protein